MEPYSADRSLYGKLRRRLARLVATKPARLSGLSRPLLTISFDDAPVSAAHEGAAILERHGARGTYFISTGLSGQESHLGRYTDAADIRALHAAGHEIACHTLTHLDCGRAKGTAIAAELDANHDALIALGVPAPRTFAYPYGDVSPASKDVLNTRFTASRALHHGLVVTGTDLNQAPAVGIEGADGEDVARHWLARAAAMPDSWLILYTHDVREKPSSWGCTPQVLERLVSEAVAKDFEIVTFEDGTRRALVSETTKAA
ncbi:MULTISPECIES: polysaccharide deacetylase family protein [Asticcacaulis]|uniref:polysaccharide deacetylase family protein n=1 Tax=Asticcacaulis TaxID=76890 RepID=UPI001AE8BCFE|nr:MULTISPECIES: polysaccharide deacetylase family protein [Asticcacaulis]MBP2161646.1 peptidoglycan/xylan/chitin deacetylase (PgdA/CDA1 family) [Asticcacaulis solisilvae]MDR6802729.1 peptidoglycan/xylan/chitin deacetylase (PgdA/CDA1 family) [Asticcacaulis sp. BE141]